jgi:enterochelin esterase family protein
MKSNTLETLSPRIQRLQHDIQSVGSDALRAFWEEVTKQGAPIIEPGPSGFSFVTFLWRDDGSARQIAVIQDWGADGIREHHMARLPGSDVWYLTRFMRSDTRTTYQLSPSPASDSSERAPYQLDPLNPQTFTAYLSETSNDILFSLLELPESPVLPWRQTEPLAAGSIKLHTPFADERRLWVYTPPTEVTHQLPVLVVFDGRLYKDQLKLPEMLDYLIGTGKIPPVAALLVDNMDRTELVCQAEFAGYMTKQVLPWLRASYPITEDARQTIIAGSSYGGLGAAYLAFQYPEVWGNVLSQTGWFRWHPEDETEHHWLARQLVTAPKLPIRFWLQVGNLETAQMLDGGPSQLAANQYFRDTLRAKGYEVFYSEYSGGHDASSLEFPLAQGLIEILT